ncbi:hypothetical protein [Shewanella saliphila]|uniref:Uncharacterized protein n=1 Tax=Shewanella saliphila TaxID=2282698 RepID=A0ABQ2Q983_9GAMM|nr:hypothetical protein [Shewanella saliphila]MCL1100866.1 hypothetical protein [Shewanella saliphila]GGP60573.1 hypothetical protein GCM10009409_28070 [Shewanella saliphila]
MNQQPHHVWLLVKDELAKNAFYFAKYKPIAITVAIKPANVVTNAMNPPLLLSVYE